MKKLVAGIFGALIGAALASQAGLTHHYSFDDGTANDGVGSVDGIAGAGASLGATGRYGQGAFFAGLQDAHIKFLSDNTELAALSAESTIAYWMYTVDGADQGDNQLISGWSFIMGGGDAQGINVSHGKGNSDASDPVSAPGTTAFIGVEAFDNWPISVNYLGNSQSSEAFGTWHHIALARDSAANRTTWYLDGVAQVDNNGGATDLQVMVNAPQGFSWALGSQDVNNDRSFHGFIDDLKIYDEYLDENGVMQAMIPEPSMVALLGLGGLLLSLRRRK